MEYLHTTNETPTPSVPLNPFLIFKPFTLKEVHSRIRRLRSNVAPGMDGIRKHHLQSQGCIEALWAFFNLALVSLKQPILKEGKDQALADNYRPITISSILSRIYWGIVDQRMREFACLNIRQKGFTNEPGCFNNISLFNMKIYW